MPPAQPTGWADDGGEGRGSVGVTALMLPVGSGVEVGLE